MKPKGGGEWSSRPTVSCLIDLVATQVRSRRNINCPCDAIATDSAPMERQHFDFLASNGEASGWEGLHGCAENVKVWETP